MTTADQTSVHRASVHQWSGRETRLLRQALRLSVRAFAEHLGVCVRTVSKWEALGPALTPRPELQAALDTALRRSTDEDRERFHSAATARPLPPTSSRSGLGPAVEGRVEGRLEGVEGRLEGRVEGRVEGKHVVAALEDAHRYLDGAVVDYYGRQLARLKSVDGQLGARAVLPQVLAVLGAIQSHAREVRPAVRRDLLAVGARGAEFAGWLYRDGRDTIRALYWHDRATEWAQLAGDAPMQGYVLLKKAQSAYDDREPARMLALSQAARSGPWRLPLRVQAEAAQQEARAEAMLGVPAHLLQRRLELAQELLCEDGASPDRSTLGGHYTAAVLSMQTAACHVEAGQPQQAVELYQAALPGGGFSPRDQGFFLSWLAGAQALAGAPDQAAHSGLEAITLATATGSVRTQRELVRVLALLRPWRQRPAVRELSAAVRG